MVCLDREIPIDIIAGQLVNSFKKRKMPVENKQILDLDRLRRVIKPLYELDTSDEEEEKYL